MKKSLKIILSLLVLSICVAGTIEGKTTSKKKSTRTTKSGRVSGYDCASELIRDFPVLVGDDLGNPGEFSDMLTILGFSPGSETKIKTELDDDYVYATRQVFVGNNVTVTAMSYEDYIFNVEIKFKNSSHVSKFVDRMKANGWKYISTYNGSNRYSNGSGTMYVKGLTVILDYGA